MRQFFTLLGCPACPRNLQYVLNGVVEEFLNVSVDVKKLQNFTDVGDFFYKTTLRLVMAKVRNIDSCFLFRRFTTHGKIVLCTDKTLVKRSVCGYF